MLTPRALATAICHVSLTAGLMLPMLAQAAPPPPAIPDAGRLSRELQQPVEPPRTGVTVTVPQLSRDVVAPGGLKVMLTSVSFSGNSVFTNAQLAAFVKPAIGNAYDLAGLYDLADQVSALYRDQGYAFAKVFVPQNGFKDGALTLQVVEGRFGDVRAKADTPRRSAQAQRFLNDLKPGQVINNKDLERTTLILSDQPGYSLLPTIKPGQTPGSGDLEAALTRTPLVRGNVSVSNHGNRYTGYYQARANVVLNSPLLFGDQLAFSQLLSDERLRSSTINYSLPLGGSGLRATAGYSITEYRLGREFANLQASGRAQTSTLGLSYPIVRTRKANLSTTVQAQHKRFFDEQQAVNAQVSRASDSVNVALNFDRSDSTGVTYGQIDWTVGSFDGPTPDTALTQGRFARINADVVRLQRLTDQLSLFLRANGQVASENLDSSESYSLGGPYAVRAYATGEGTGDQGRFGQIELRYQTREGLNPYVFFDAGTVRIEHKATAPGKTSRSLSGAGAGLRYQHGPWSLDTLIARRLVGGKPETDPRDGSLIAWMILSYAF